MKQNVKYFVTMSQLIGVTRITYIQIDLTFCAHKRLTFGPLFKLGRVLSTLEKIRGYPLEVYACCW